MWYFLFQVRNTSIIATAMKYAPNFIPSGSNSETNKLLRCNIEGARLFTGLFRRMSLLQQMRVQDEEHLRYCNLLRNGQQEGTQLSEYIRRHILTAEDREEFGVPVRVIWGTMVQQRGMLFWNQTLF